MGEAKRRKALGLPPRGKPAFTSIKPSAKILPLHRVKEGERVSIEGTVYIKHRGQLRKATPAFVKKFNALRAAQLQRSHEISLAFDEAIEEDYLRRKSSISFKD